jgi:F-type H+-transporting ATPase subunit alpha
MSITDGQWILDMEVFRSGVRPALSMSLSVTRAGGIGHNKRQKALAARTLKTLADYRQAEEFAHFGSELPPEAKQALATGKRILRILTQNPSDMFPLMAQQLMLDIILNLSAGEELELEALKLNAIEFAKQVTDDKVYESVRAQLKSKVLIQVQKPVQLAKPAATAKQQAPAGAKK